jgi:hypothetical protein
LLLLLSPTLPGPARTSVLPALLLGPGAAFLLSIGGRVRADADTFSVAAPLSVALAIAACLLMDAVGVILGPTSVALGLGCLTVALTSIGYFRRRTERGMPA